MPTRRSTLDHLLEQAAGAGLLAARPMFGEYGLYCDGTLVGSVCDDQLYLKPTAAGRALAGDGTAEAAPYPGAKPCLLIPGDRWDDAPWLSALIRASAAALPARPPPKRGSAGGRKGKA